MTIKAFDENGQIIDVSSNTPVNDLTRAPKFMDEMPEGVMFVPVIIPAADGETPRIALVNPTLIATTEEVTGQIVAAVNTARQEFVDAGIQRDEVQQEQIDRADDFAASLASMLAAIQAKKQLTQIGTVTISQTAAVAITAGVRQFTPTLNGLVAGEPVVVMPQSIPANYLVGLPFVSANNVLTVPITCPLLALGASFTFNLRVFAFR